MTMFQYSNSAYINKPSSIETLSHHRFRYDDTASTPGPDRTVGIGYYGASRTDLSEARLARSSMPRGADKVSLASPTLSYSRANMSDYWNDIQGTVDLSPETGSHVISSPIRPLSEGSVLDAYAQSHMSPAQRQGSNSVPLLGYSDASPRSTDPSCPSFSVYPAWNPETGKSVSTSLREKWERSRLKLAEDSIDTKPPLPNKQNVSSTSMRSYHELSSPNKSRPPATIPNISRHSVGDALSGAVYSQAETPQSTMERQYNTLSTSSSLKRDPLSHRKLPNGSAKLTRDGSLNTSHRSLNISHLSLRSQSGKATLYGHGYGVHNSLVNMGVAALLSLIMCFLCTQLLFQVSTRQAYSLIDSDSVLQSNESHSSVAEVVVAFTSIAIMLDLCCLLTCSLQAYFAAKLIKCKQGEERAFRYLKECMPTRSIAIIGFFISVPAFFFGLMLYIIMEYRTTPAIIAVVVLTIGVSFSISMAVHSTFMWTAEKSQADQDIPVFTETNNNKSKVIGAELTNQNELSTLV